MPEQAPTPAGLYSALGGASGCRALSSALYANIDRDPDLRPLFPGKTLHCAIEAFTAFLVQFLGGPAEYTQRRWWVSLRESHLRFHVDQRRRDAWLRHMYHALDEAAIDETARTALRQFFDRSSSYLINDGLPAGADRPTGGELADRWHTQLTADEAVAAIRNSDFARAIELTQMCAAHSRPLYAGLVAQMIASRAPELLTFIREQLLTDSRLVTQRWAGRTFLHVAAGAGTLDVVHLLLRLGVDPNTIDSGGHTALYSVANECDTPSGADIVRALVEAGAAVDACGGIQRCTPLHMAARRGNAQIAAALLDCGARLEARDRGGDTPLRRAVNCNQVAAAGLLLSRGADPDCVGSKGLTPQSAARSSAMKALFQT